MTIDKYCRICYDNEKFGKMIRPCNCKGSIEYVHISCLNSWREYKTMFSKEYIKCMLCNTEYKFEEYSVMKEKVINLLKYDIVKIIITSIIMFSIKQIIDYFIINLYPIEYISNKIIITFFIEVYINYKIIDKIKQFTKKLEHREIIDID